MSGILELILDPESYPALVVLGIVAGVVCISVTTGLCVLAYGRRRVRIEAGQDGVSISSRRDQTEE